MRSRQRLVISLVVLSLLSPTIAAQQTHIADPAAVDRALASHAAATEAKREIVRTALQQSEVQRIAAQLGFDLARAEAAVGTLHGVDLELAASQAQQVNDQIAGGQTVRLNLLWVIIGLLVIILIIVAA